MSTRQSSYPLSAVSCIVLPVSPIMNVISLLSILDDVFVDSIINLLDLVTAEHDGLDRPIVMCNIINLRSNRCDDTEVVSSSLHTPPQVRLAVDCLQITIRKYDIHGKKLIGDQAVATLKPPVATTEGGSQITDAFAASSH
jgi:hypothetical protein